MKLAVLGALVLGVVASVAFTQAPGGGQKGRGGMDPDSQFEKYAKGKDVLSVSEVEVDERFAKFFPTEKLRESMNTYLQEKGVTNGQMTREQYREYSTWSRAKMMEQFQSGGNQFKFGKKDDAKKDGDSSQASTEDVDGKARDAFKRIDTNGDGFLSVEEIQATGRWGQRLYDEREKYDLNKDGKIDVNEYVEYYKALRSQWGDKGGKCKGGDTADKGDKGSRVNWTRDVEEDKPKAIPEVKRIVYRFGHLPKDLPKWYEELDKDMDGQVGLYEWKSSGREVAEFLAMDANGDGFVTVEEIYRYQKALAAKKVEGGNPMSLFPSPTSNVSATTKPSGKGDRGAWQNKGGDRTGKGKGKGKGNYGG